MLKGFFDKFKNKKNFQEEELNLEIKEEILEIPEENATQENIEEAFDEIAECKAEENEAFDELEELGETEETKETVSENTDLIEEKVESATEETVTFDEPFENEEKEEKKGFFAKLTAGLSKTKSAISEKVDSVLGAFKTVDEDLFEELEEALIMADIGVDTSLFIIEELRNRAKKENIKEASELKAVLKEIITDILKGTDSVMHLDSKPSVIMVIGVNGVGKTTSIGKLAKSYVKEGKKVILAAGDTFRAAAIDQLEIWAERSGADIVKHTEGSDPSAVVFDAIKAAKARGADVVICDTAGRLHNKKHLMEELAKTSRVIERETGHAPDEFLLVLDGSTGQNALIQAKEFAYVSPISGVILTKLDGTAKGGVVIALAREQGIGVKMIGVGEGPDDLQKFDPEQFADAIL